MRSGKALKNGLIGVICQIIVLVISFITRKVFLDYLSVNYLGYNGLFSNILGMLNLAELGIGTALAYKFYAPMAEEDTYKVSALLTVYKKIYNTIGIIVFVAGLIISPSVPYLIKDVNESRIFIITLFLIQLLGTASTYFLSYRRTIFFTAQNDYICTIADMIANIIFSILKIISIILFKNYVIYLTLQITQNYFANICITVLCKKRFPQYKILNGSDQGIKEQLAEAQKSIVETVKYVFVGKFAIYVFSSTDNIIISSFVGISSVGLLSNYTLITSTITTFLNKLLDPIQAGIGNALNSKDGSGDKVQLYYNFQFLQCSIGMIASTGCFVLLNPFVQLYFGEEYILPMSIIIVLSINLYLDIAQRPSCNFINAAGLFSYDRKLSIVGAISNLTISLILVKFCGMLGVLIGTTVSQILFLFMRSSTVLKKYLKVNIREFYSVFSQITGLSIFWGCIFSYLSIFVDFNYFYFFACGVLLVCSEAIALFLIYRKSKMLIYFEKMLLRLIHRTKG